MILALLLLLSASDSFSSLNPQWQWGMRKDGQVAIVQKDGDDCLELRATFATGVGVGDYVRLFLRPALVSERPFAQCHIYIPPFNEWPTQPNINGSYNYCGFRLTITREQGGGLVWPGCFITGGPSGPHFTARILSDYFGRSITSDGWWTIGCGCTDSGLLKFYAVQGRVALTESDLFFTDPAQFPTTVRSFDGWFLQVALAQGQTLGDPWYFGDVELWCNIRPTLDISRNGSALSLTVTGFPTEPYQIERSTDLLSWEAFTGTMDAITEPQQFYRIHQP